MIINSTANTIIIGIGSPYGADQLGWQVVDQLKTRQAVLSKPNIRLETCDRPGTLLLDYMKGVQKAILIDAIEGGTSGNMRMVDKQELLDEATPHSSHQLGVAEAILLGEKLHLLPQEMVLLGVETGGLSQRYHLSMEVINRVADSVVQETNSL